MRALLISLVFAASVAYCSGNAERLREAVDTRNDPCYSEEHGRVLPPLYGTDC